MSQKFEEGFVEVSDEVNPPQGIFINIKFNGQPMVFVFTLENAPENTTREVWIQALRVACDRLLDQIDTSMQQFENTKGH